MGKNEENSSIILVPSQTMIDLYRRKTCSFFLSLHMKMKRRKHGTKSSETGMSTALAYAVVISIYAHFTLIWNWIQITVTMFSVSSVYNIIISVVFNVWLFFWKWLKPPPNQSLFSRELDFVGIKFDCKNNREITAKFNLCWNYATDATKNWNAVMLMPKIPVPICY